MYHVISGVRRSNRLSVLFNLGPREREKFKPHIYLSSPIFGKRQWVSSGSLEDGVVEFIMHLDKTHPLTKQA